ncbi:reverse transcriptase family protein [Anaerocolumna xylanovorans]|uniref:RNA-directed DNA polymerase n=1 Tax=Anaerocolumna xylanovorans DSM 12503 TaxID=1121345 RepID=A0A1M7Y7U9_9FIRM|nr:reverse transcriptase family protein [Anaerocolumna xylanovorans]SHO48702.1 Retron-type reverse transcriptase [Anaerocolumna xylanovorans DSM 12503]
MYEDAKEKSIISQDAYQLIKIYIGRLEDNDIPVIFNLRHLRKILKIPKQKQSAYFGVNRNEMYRKFMIPKKSGGYRKIEAPSEELKLRQLWIKENIIDKFKISDSAQGFRKNHSIYGNALPHVGKELVINIDIKDFFPSITYQKVFKFFRYIGYTNQVSHLLTKMCTNVDNVLPQGSPASPSLSNIVLLKMDKRLSKLAGAVECDYTRYADDITFSGKKVIKSLVPIICKIIEEEGYDVNKGKLRLQYSNQRQEVTGLTVNKKVSLSKRTIKEIENAIYYCKKYGVQEHMTRIKCDKSFYKEHLYGIAYFIKMIDKEKGKKYLEELNRIEWLY